MLAHLSERNTEDFSTWDDDSYTSVAPWVCEYRNVIVHSTAGIIVIDDKIVLDTLLQTSEECNGYSVFRDRTWLSSNTKIKFLQGSYLSLLSGNHNNYYHWTMDCVARLAAVDLNILGDCSCVLIPEPARDFQKAGIAWTGLKNTHDLIPVASDETVFVERLLVPGSIHGHHTPHPCINAFFRGMARVCGQQQQTTPRRIYIDRRASINRHLQNEELVVQALEARGFVAIQLERLTLEMQVTIFQNADIIVGPHGAGLTNIVFAKPGSSVIEIHCKDHLNWCFRRLAAVTHLNYDCVVGRRSRGITGNPNQDEWEVSLIHLISVVECACDEFTIKAGALSRDHRRKELVRQS